MLTGYARVSTIDQNLELQIDALKKAGCEKIFEDRKSGSKWERKGLADAVSHLRPGDTLLIWKLDRLGRSIVQLVGLVNDLAARGVGFQSLTDGIDTCTTSGRFFFKVMCALAEMERDLVSERTKAGLAAARARGRCGGRPRKLTPEQIDAARRMIDGGMSVVATARVFSVSRGTLYENLNRLSPGLSTPPLALGKLAR